MTYQLTLTINKVDGTKDYDFCNIEADSKEQAIKIHTSNLNVRIERAKAGNRYISREYATWKSFELV